MQLAARFGAGLRAHEHRTAALLFAFLVVVYLWPVLAGGGVLSPASLLYGVPPWKAAIPANGIAYYNGLLSDVPMSYYPLDVLARSFLHSGTFPAWNAHAFAGTPLYANLSVAWLSPFSLPLWVLPLNYALGVVAALKLWAGAFGAYLLARELRLGFWPGLLAGVSFAFCAFDIAWLTHGAHVSVAVLMPWTLWLAERILRRGGQVEGIALAGVAAAALAGGHPGTQVHILAGTLLYALMRAALLTDVARAERLRRLATLTGGIGAGALLMAVVLVPGERAAIDAVGATARRAGGSLADATLPLDALRAALFPDWWGRPSEALLTGPGNYNERTFYAGVPALVLALVALVSRGAWRRKAPFATLAAIGLAVPLGAPLIRPLVVHLPAFDRVQNERLMLWYLLAVALLGAFGLDSLLAAPRRQRRAWIVVGAAALAGGYAAVTIDAAPGDLGRALDHLTDRFAGATAGGLALASVARLLLLVLLAAGALALMRARPRWASIAGGLVVLVAALDLLLWANAYQPMGPAAITIPPRTAAIAYLQRHADDGRIVGLEAALTNDWSMTYGLRDARGYDAPQPSSRFFQLWRRLSPQQTEWRPFDVPGLTPTGMSVLGLLGVRYVVTGPGAGLPRGHAAYRALSYAYRGEDATVFENALAAPRAFVAERVHVAGDEDDEIATVATPAFDPRREAVVRGDDLVAAPPASGPGPGGTVRVADEQNARVALHATLARRALVVLDDAWAPGWSVTVDGRSAQALQADVVMRGVVVPAGRHEIVWTYRVPGLRLGALLSALGLLALLGWTGTLLVRRRRRAG